MLPWKILGWIALAIVVVSVAAVSLAGFALYSTGREAVQAVERVGQAPVSQAPVPVHVGAPYGCQPADMAYPPCNSLAP